MRGAGGRQRGSGGSYGQDGGLVVDPRFNALYSGNRHSRGRCVAYHQLVADVQRKRYHGFLLREMVVHLSTLVLAVSFITSQLALDRVGAMRFAQEQLFLQTSVVSTNLARTFTFESISSAADVVQYLANVVYLQVLDPSEFAATNYTTVQAQVTLLWGVRFRAVEVTPNEDCGWKGPAQWWPVVDEHCAPLYSRGVESTQSRCGYPYRTAAETDEEDFVTNFNRYPGSGLVRELLVTGDAADRSIFDEFQRMFTLDTGPVNAAFINANTALLLVTMTLFNPSTNVIAFPRLGFEFLPSGLVVPHAELRAAPFLPNHSGNGSGNGGYDQAARVLGALLVVAIPLRIFFVALHMRRVSCLSHYSLRKNIAGHAVDLALSGMLLAVLVDVFTRVFLHREAEAVLDAIASRAYYAGAGLLVDWWWTLQSLYAYTAVLLCVYMAKYWKLFHGLRFLWCVAFVAASDLVAVYGAIFFTVLALGVFALVLFGPYAMSYVTVYKALSTVLLQVTGFFSLDLLAYATPADSFGIYSYYLAVFVLLFTFLLLNFYVSVILKAFGITYSEALEDESANTASSAPVHSSSSSSSSSSLSSESTAAATATATAMSMSMSMSLLERHHGTRSVRLAPSRGIKLSNECRAWCGRNRQLSNRCASSLCAGNSCWALLGSVLCCSNHQERDWLPLDVVLRRLAEWKKKHRNHSRNFLDFATLRTALQGDAKTYRRVDNTQVDSLFALCTLTRTLPEAAQAQRTIDDLVRSDQSTAAHIRRVIAEARRRDAEQRRHDKTLLDECGATYSAFMKLKKSHMAADIALSSELEQIAQNQALKVRLLDDIRHALDLDDQEDYEDEDDDNPLH